jgi:WhiB family redox-sensing transcriptional regulator
MERLSVSRTERSRTPLEQAHEAFGWLSNYMYGWTDEAEELPALATERLVTLFGSEEVEAHLARLKAVFLKIPAEHQTNVGLLIAGYPDEVMAELSEVAVEQTFTVLRQLMNLPAPEEYEADRPAERGRRLRLPLRVVQALPDPDAESRQLGFMTSREGLEWQDDALCAQTDPEAFFPEKGGSTRDAKKVCAECQVRDDCLEYALVTNQRFGIWGGQSERERRRLQARKNRTVRLTTQNETSDTTS